MSEPIVAPTGRPGASEHARRPRLHALAGVLPDGTPHHVPVGEVWVDRHGVCCHLCGRWFRSVAAHLGSHGWSRQRYLEAFGLEQAADLECGETRDRRAAAFGPRRTFEPAVRAGVAEGQALARSGALAEHAAKAARGRAHPPQRRAKTLASLQRVSRDAQAAANRERRRRELEQTAAVAATTLGFPSLTALVTDRVGRGASLAAVSREAGLHKDWLQRHLAGLDPALAARLDTLRPLPAERRLLARARVLGFADLAAYLRVRVAEEGRSVNAVARELGVARSSVDAALRRHGVRRPSRRADPTGRQVAPPRVADA